MVAACSTLVVGSAGPVETDAPANSDGCRTCALCFALDLDMFSCRNYLSFGTLVDVPSGKSLTLMVPSGSWNFQGSLGPFFQPLIPCLQVETATTESRMGTLATPALLLIRSPI
ncbi:hypothetical protein CCUS01_02227 [Colletotrichum cuscutae]|uniref:Uncharacterized protein n=1 Tax=Colletotrichum cuscutae TaxID=1209917 RepID=A0AAI9U6N1_9PEZI|nr:hypothetical protein CCUS01_02227 [Colletotrichum cuscutae]